MIVSGGKSRRTTAPRLLLQAHQALLEKPFPPFAYDLPRRVQSPGNLVVSESLGGVKDDPGPDDVSIR